MAATIRASASAPYSPARHHVGRGFVMSGGGRLAYSGGRL
jgi:hypothetical protein